MSINFILVPQIPNNFILHIFYPPRPQFPPQAYAADRSCSPRRPKWVCGARRFDPGSRRPPSRHIPRKQPEDCSCFLLELPPQDPGFPHATRRRRPRHRTRPDSIGLPRLPFSAARSVTAAYSQGSAHCRISARPAHPSGSRPTRQNFLTQGACKMPSGIHLPCGSFRPLFCYFPFCF